MKDKLEVALILAQGRDLPVMLGRIKNPQMVAEVIAEVIAAADQRAKSADPVSAAGGAAQGRVLRRLLGQACDPALM